jgi:hypothetical protein
MTTNSSKINREINKIKIVSLVNDFFYFLFLKEIYNGI